MRNPFVVIILALTLLVVGLIVLEGVQGYEATRAAEKANG